MQVLRTHAAAIEVYSIDEAFLRWTAWRQSTAAGRHAHHVRDTVRQWTGHPRRCRRGGHEGAGQAGEPAREEKRRGVRARPREPAKDRRCRGLARGANFGAWRAGWKSGWRAWASTRRGSWPGRSARSCARASAWWSSGWPWSLRGVSCLELEEVQPDRKNICCSRSFGRPVESLEELREAVATHATRAGRSCARRGWPRRRCACFW